MSTTSRIPKRPAGDRRPRARRAAGVRGGDPGSAPTPTTGHATAQPSAAGETRKHLKPVPAVIDLGKVDLDELDLGSLSVEPGQHLALNGRGAVGAGPVDPLALGLFGLVRNDCHADRLLVWQELASTLDGGLDDDARLGLAAARVCCEHLAAADPERDFGVAPLSEREYDAWWRADEHRRRSWPSVSSLRRWLGDGSWFGVLDRLGQMPGPSRVAQRLTAQLGAFSADELKAQLALCRAELSEDRGVPLDYVSQREHREWALKRLGDPDLPLARLCLQPHTFRKLFGSWSAAVEASGGCRTDGGRRAAHSTTRPLRFYTADACVRAVRFVGERAGRGRMRWPDYDRVASRLKRQPRPSAGVPEVLPAGATVVERLGSWPQALYAAGLIDAAERDRRLARVTVTLSDKTLLSKLAEALRAIGADAPRGRYRRYREAMRAQHGPHVGFPSLATVYQRLGPWPEAKAAVAAAHPDILTCIPTWTEEED